jgi:hypothetical protein
MDSKQIERQNAIMHICERYAYKDKGYYQISFWELAAHLNNCWYAELFVSRKLANPKYNKLGRKDTSFAVDNFSEHMFLRMVNETCKKWKDCRIIKQGGNNPYITFYRIRIKTEGGEKR